MINFFNAETFINTTSDAGDYKLQVDGNIYNTGSSVFNATSGESYFGTTTDAGNYRVQVSGNAYVTGDAILAATSGNVGIGNLTPANLLDVQKNQNTSTIVRVLNTSTQSAAETKFVAENSAYRLDAGIRSTGTAVFGALDAGSAYLWYNGTTSLVIGATDASGIIKFNTGGTTEKLRIHANGGLKYVPQSAAPTAEAGTVYYDSDDNKLKVYNGTTWVDLH